MKNEEKHPADITRREALKKIGKYGLYVPPTLAVLSAAPRAFAQSCLTATLTGTVWDIAYEPPQPLKDAEVRVECLPVLSTMTDDNGQFTIPNIPPGDWWTEAKKDSEQDRKLVHFEASCKPVNVDFDI